MKDNIQDSLLQVRRAYRFIYDYQRRVLNLMDFIGGSFKVVYQGGYPKFSNSGPKGGQGKLDLWAWDWLNMYFYEFHFKRQENGKDKISFAVFLVTDTGYFQADSLSFGERTNPDLFAKEEDSQTKLIFTAGKNMWKEWGTHWADPEFILKKEGKRVDGDGFMIFRSYGLEEFADELGAINKLRDFSEYCKLNDVPIRYHEKLI